MHQYFLSLEQVESEKLRVAPPYVSIYDSLCIEIIFLKTIVTTNIVKHFKVIGCHNICQCKDFFKSHNCLINTIFSAIKTVVVILKCFLSKKIFFLYSRTLGVV